jgi:predicted dehydrogenase
MTLSRRNFLRTAALATLAFPAIVRARNLNSQVQIAAVGVDGKGYGDINECASHPKAHFVGFCDIDAGRFAKIDKRYPGVTHYSDWREMYTWLGDGFDAVTVSTPDHMHALPTMVAMRMGKHVYCQKPLTHTAWEARQLRLQAAKSKVRTQMGNQIHSAKEYRTGVKLIQTGRIGKILAVHTWHPNRGNAYTGMTAAPASGPVPAGVSWDLWLGTAPAREFAPDVYHPFKWRDWVDFGSGTMGDFGCHLLDPVFTALKLGVPLSVKADSVGANAQTWCAQQTIEWIFPGTEYTKGNTLSVTWYDGGRLPDATLALLPPGKTLSAAGSIFIGEHGVMMLPHIAMPSLYPEEKFGKNLNPGDLARRARAKDKPTDKVAIDLPDFVEGSSHYHAWVDAITQGHETTDNFAYAGPLTEAVQLGNVASRFSGVKLEWDAAAMKFPNKPEAEALLTKEYRKGWELIAADR